MTMPDDPHAPEHKDEASFMLAAETAIQQLQVQANEAKTAAEEAKDAADRSEKSAKRWKILTVVMSVIIALTLALSALGVNLWLEQRAATGQLQQASISSCEVGNDRAQGTVDALSQLVNILEGPNPTAAVKQVADNYTAFVLSHNRQRDCQTAYQLKNNAANPSSIGTIYVPDVSVAIPVARG